LPATGSEVRRVYRAIADYNVSSRNSSSLTKGAFSIYGWTMGAKVGHGLTTWTRQAKMNLASIRVLYNYSYSLRATGAWPTCITRLCVQLTTWHCSHLLLSAVACCSNRSISPARRADADMDRKAAAARQTDGQTYGRTPYRYMDPAAYYANSANKGRWLLWLKRTAISVNKILFPLVPGQVFTYVGRSSGLSNDLSPANRPCNVSS